MVPAGSAEVLALGVVLPGVLQRALALFVADLLTGALAPLQLCRLASVLDG